MTPRFRPLPQSGGPRPADSLPLAGGPLWFREVVEHRRGAAPRIVEVTDLPDPIRHRLSAQRPPICGITFDRPRIMGILNVTPDSFSDGGLHATAEEAVARAREMIAEGADIVDIGGESTRPGAEPVPVEEEIARVVPVVEALRRAGLEAPISVDTRNAAVASAAMLAGADMVNDVSALRHDPDMGILAAQGEWPICLMHAQGDPRTMQDAPVYDDVLLDVADFLDQRVERFDAGEVRRRRVMIDPGIGFGKTLEHNLALLRGIGLLHGIGCPILLGASRKRFIGTIAGVPDPRERMPGSIAVALEALRQGVQVVRVHDVKETRQAIDLWLALNRDEA